MAAGEIYYSRSSFIFDENMLERKSGIKPGAKCSNLTKVLVDNIGTYPIKETVLKINIYQLLQFKLVCKSEDRILFHLY